MTPATSVTEVLQLLSTEIMNVREGDLLQLGNLIDKIDSVDGADSPEVKDIRDRMAQLTLLSGAEFEAAHAEIKARLLGEEATPAAETLAAPESSSVVEELTVPDDGQIGGMDQELYAEFVDEALSHLQSIELNILSLETDAGNMAIINCIFRPFHTIKGVSGFLGLSEINALCHDAENLLDDARKGILEISGAVSDLVLETVDLLKEMIPLCRDSADPPGALKPYGGRVKDFQVRIAALKKNPPRPGAVSEEAPPIKPLGEIMVESLAITTDNLDEAINTQQESGGSLGEILITEHEVKPIEVAKALRTQQSDKVAAVAEPVASPGGGGAETIRVSTSLLDQLMNLAGELVLGRNQLLQRLSGVADEVHGLSSILHGVDRVTSEVQEAVMQTRMQPLAGLFSRFHRVIRDLSRSMRKKIHFQVSGETVELDKTLIEALGDPLTHLIRNCADHGVEPPAERVAAGKPEEGRISLSAAHEGGKVHVIVSDDGAGIDVERIKNKAIESNLITREKAAQMSEREALRLLFAPGFSMATVVTDVSGRGVGMDVVLSNIENIGGSVDITTESGKGTTFLLDLPLTLAIVPALIVSARDQRFAIPQTNLVEMVHLESEQARREIQQVRGSEVYSLRGELLPLLRLGEVLQIEDPAAKANGSQASLGMGPQAGNGAGEPGADHLANEDLAGEGPEEAELEGQARERMNLYDKLGGGPAIKTLVEQFYERVLGDSMLAHAFENVDMADLKRDQALFISQALGGPNNYSGRDMKAAHEKLGITAEQFAHVGGHLQSTMEALGVEAEDISTIMATIGSFQDQVGADSTDSLALAVRQQKGDEHGEGLSIVVMSSGHKQFGLIVDRVYDTEEIVVKPLSNLLKDVGVFAGATLMGDGQAALILDITGVVQAAGVMTEEDSSSSFLNAKETATQIGADTQTILVFNINPEEQLAVSLTLISRLETVKVSDIHKSINGKVIPYRDRLLPLAFLEDHTDIGKPPQDRETVKVLVFEIEHPVGLVVSEIIDSVEVPVNLDDSSISKKGFSGVAIVNEVPTAFVDIYQVIEMAYPDWFKRDKEMRETQLDKASKTILLAEDSSFYRNVERDYLLQDGFQVLEAEDGQQALDILAKQRVDLLVTDIEMPRVNGFELVEKIRATDRLKELPIIAVTSLSDDAERERGKAVGIDSYLIKLRREILMKEVFRLLGSANNLKVDTATGSTPAVLDESLAGHVAATSQVAPLAPSHEAATSQVAPLAPSHGAKSEAPATGRGKTAAPRKSAAKSGKAKATPGKKSTPNRASEPAAEKAKASGKPGSKSANNSD